MIKNFILLIIISIFSYNNICQNETKNFIKKLIHVKDIIYFNKKIINMSDTLEWNLLFKKLNITNYNNKTLHDFINNIYNKKTIILLDNIYKNIKNIKYIRNDKYINSYKKYDYKKNIYWKYITFNDINNTLLQEVCNKSFNAWMKYVKCINFINSNNNYYDIKISIIDDINAFDRSKNILATYYNKYIHFNYINIKKNINNEKFLIIVLMHEIGHYLKLSHISNYYSIMNPQPTNNIYSDVDLDNLYKIIHYFDINRLRC